MGASVVRRSNCAEAFLSGRVPDLELDRLLVQLNSADFLRNKKTRKLIRETDAPGELVQVKQMKRQVTYKVDSNGGNIRLRVRIVSESKQQTRLSDARVSNEEELEEVIAVGKGRGWKLRERPR